MKKLPEGSNGAPAMIVQPVALPEGFSPSWAGALHRGVFCFGSEDGKWFFTYEQGKSLSEPAKTSVSGEAVNGAAISGIWIAASTRADVTFLQMMPDAKGARSAFTFPHGAHGIISTPSGYFLAPLGQTGTMAVAPPFAPDVPITVHPAKEGVYHYRVGCVVMPNKAELLITAGRLGGLAFGEFRATATSQVMNTMALPGLDVVDFCPLFPSSSSLAVAVLGRDRRLLLFKDLLTDRQPATFDFKSLMGTAYRVLSIDGDVYVVTSKGIYMLARLGTRFMNSRIGDNIHTQILVMQMVAVDANLCGDDWMLVVTPDGVQRLDVRALHEAEAPNLEGVTQNRLEESQPAVVSEGLRFHDVTQNSSEYALAS